MTIFAVDSAGKTAGVAIVQNNILVYESYLANGLTHSETLLSLCQNALQLTKLSVADIDVFAVTAGPGSFTGLRIGLAAVKGMAFAHATPCAAVSTLRSLAHTVCCDGLIACALDARRGEVYGALFRKEGGMLTPLLQDTALPAAALAERALAYGERVVCLGDGAHLVVQAASNPLLQQYPSAYCLGRAHGVAAGAAELHATGTLVPPEALVPQYHRLSQAERQRAQMYKGETI